MLYPHTYRQSVHRKGSLPAALFWLRRCPGWLRRQRQQPRPFSSRLHPNVVDNIISQMLRIFKWHSCDFSGILGIFFRILHMAPGDTAKKPSHPQKSGWAGQCFFNRQSWYGHAKYSARIPQPNGQPRICRNWQC